LKIWKSVSIPGAASQCRHLLLHNGAVFDTRAAAGAPVFDDGSGALFNLDLEVSGFALDGFEIRIGDQFDV
jgi:hypothetical protein